MVNLYLVGIVYLALVARWTFIAYRKAVQAMHKMDLPADEKPPTWMLVVYSALHSLYTPLVALLRPVVLRTFWDRPFTIRTRTLRAKPAAVK